MLTEKKYGARLAVNKGKGALRIILKALFPLWRAMSVRRHEIKIASGRKPAALKCRISRRSAKFRAGKPAGFCAEKFRKEGVL